MTSILIRLGAAVMGAIMVAAAFVLQALVETVEAILDHLPGDNAEQRLADLGLACVGLLTLTTAAAVLAVALTLGA